MHLALQILLFLSWPAPPQGLPCASGRRGLASPTQPASPLYGRAVALDERFAFVASDGVVEVFARTGTSWHHDGSLAPATPRPGESFGTALALDAGLLAVCAPSASPYTEPSAVYFFALEGDAWRERARVEALGPRRDENFGDAVELHAGTLVVGARYASETAYVAGAVYVFREERQAWKQEARLVQGPSAPFGGAYAEFGAAVSMRGDRLLVGAPGVDRVHEFVRTRAGWVERTVIQGSAPASTRFGAALALRGELLLVGEPHWPSAIFPLGAAVPLRSTPGGWVAEERILAPELSIGFGGNVARDGDLAAFGTLGDVGLFRSEGVWIARALEGGWTKPQRTDGRLTALAAGRLLVGDPGHSGEPGEAAVLPLGVAEPGGVEYRSATGNLDLLRAEPASVGRTLELRIDGGTSSDRIFAFVAPASLPTGLGALLCWDRSGAPLFLRSASPDGFVHVAIPPAPDLTGFAFSVQALVRRPPALPRLTNALDFTIGACRCDG